MDPKQCTIWPVLDIKVCNKHGRISVEVQVQSLFGDQTESWIRIVNSIDKCVREAMPIQEEEKASVKPAAEARPILKPSSTSGWDSTLMKQRQWIDIEIQESKDLHCFQESKFIDRLLRHSKQVRRERMEESTTTKLLKKTRKSYQTIQDTGQTKWRSNSLLLRIGHLNNGYQFWQKVEDRRKGSNIAWTRTFLRNSCTFEQSKDMQEEQSILHCKTMYCYQKVTPSFLSRRKRKRIEVNSENNALIPGGVSLKTGSHAVFFTIVNQVDNQDGFGETLCDLPKARTAPYKNTWKHSQDPVFWSNLKFAQQRGLQFYQRSSNAVALYDTLPAEFIWKAICMKTKGQLYQRERVILSHRVVLRANSQSGSQDLFVQEARRWNPQQHCWLSSTRYIDLNGETAGCTAIKQRHKTYRHVRETST